MDALLDGNSVFDMSDTAPLKHWKDMSTAALEEIADNFLVSGIAPFPACRC